MFRRKKNESKYRFKLSMHNNTVTHCQKKLLDVKKNNNTHDGKIGRFSSHSRHNLL